MKKQVVLIHGGRTFETNKDYLSFLKNLEVDLDRYRKEGWHSSLRKKLGTKFDVLLPKMPNPMNAKYNEWKILFKKIAILLEESVVLIGHSLGGIFLVKYLSENQFPKKILATFIISAPYNKGMDESLSSFVLSMGLSRLSKQGGKIFLYHSKDDPVVPFAHLGRYKKALPNAIVREFKNREHFNQAEFQELIKDIKLCLKK